MHRKALLVYAISVLAPFPILASRSVTFEENRGQARPEVGFLSHQDNRVVLLMRDGTVVAPGEQNSVNVRLVGANAAPPVGVNRLAARSNYLIGSDPAGWHSGIPNYASVRYAHGWPGIDVVWHGNASQLEYDFEIAAGADPHAVRLGFAGAPIALGQDGDLMAGSMRMRAPRAFQNGREIACRYELHNGMVKFRLGLWDHSRPLTIDPVLLFSTFLGGNNTDSASVVRVDASGNIIVAGTTASLNFPVSANAFQSAPASNQCEPSYFNSVPCTMLFVTKFARDGHTLLFSTYLGGTTTSLAGMALDPAGNVYLTGLPGYNFPNLTPLPGYTANGAYIAKLSANGESLIYATQLPISGPFSSVSAIAVDAAGAAYLVGSSTGGIPAVNAMQSAPALQAMFRTTDSGKHWQSLIGDLPPGEVSAIAIDPHSPTTIYLGMVSGLYKSIDAGAHWTTVINGAPPQAQNDSLGQTNPTTILIDPSNSQTIYFGSPYGAYKSTDGGATWAPANTGAYQSLARPLSPPYVRNLAIDPTNPATLYMASDAGLFKSTNGASTWMPTGLMAAAGQAFFMSRIVIDPSSPQTLYAGTMQQGVEKSTDGGVSWTTSNTGFTYIPNITNLTIDPQNPQVLYAATTIYDPPYRTTDGGAHWTAGVWPTSQFVESFLVDPLVHTTVWAGTAAGVLVSHDSGATWNFPPIQTPQIDMPGLAADGVGRIVRDQFRLRPLRCVRHETRSHRTRDRLLDLPGRRRNGCCPGHRD